MQTINLNNLQGIPFKFINSLNYFIQDFKNTDNYENLLKITDIRNVMFDIDEYCKKNKIVAFHYTRADPESIRNLGLLCRTGKEIRESFLNNNRSLFSASEIATIIQNWNDHFDKRQQISRDNRLFFNFTTTALNDKGAEPLLSNFGGEQVYMPISEMDEISFKIKNLGLPMIIKCILDPKMIKTYSEHAFGEIAISSFHNLHNSEAFRHDQDGYQTVNVLSSNIEIIFYDKFKNYRTL